MTGWPVWWKWAGAWRFGLSSQQPTCPQVEALARIFDLRAAPPAPMSPPWLPDSQERHRQIDWRAIERDLRATLAHEVPRPSTRFCASWASTTGTRSGACPTSAGRYSVRDRHTAWRATELEDVQLCREAEVRRVIAEIDATGRYPGRRQVQKRLPPGIYMRDGAPGDALAGRGDRSGLARRPLPEAQAGRRPEGRVAAEVSRRAGRRRASRSRGAGGADRDAAAPPRATDAPRRCAGLGYGPGRPRSRLARPPGPTSPDGR